jgi:extracellular elastinolytic metalloproteinase
MSREIDLRDSSDLQNVAISTGEQTVGLVPPKDFFVLRALNHLRTIGDTIGLTATQPAEFTADHQFQRSSSGSVAVHLYQTYKNIPIFRATQTVVFAPDGSLSQSVGNGVPVGGDLDISPQLSVTEAVLVAAKFLSQPDPDEAEAKDQFGRLLRDNKVDLRNFDPKQIAIFRDLPEQPSVFDPGPFGAHIKSSLIWFPLANELRLCWEIVLALPNDEGQFRIMVDAENSRILYCAQLMQFVKARGNVFRTNGSGQRQMTNFPLPLTEYPVPPPTDLPAGFPDDWISLNEAAGNSGRAVIDSSGSTFNGSLDNGNLVFDPSDPSGNDQRLLNLFYYTCFMHDFFYLLGFRERDGNFQQDNKSRGGIPIDRLDARAGLGEVFATANMNTPVDGLAPTMKMGLVTETQRHTALDATVVFHEFTHGVTNRLVGGSMNNHALEAPQSKAMGEGWGDYIACTLNSTSVIAAWVVNNPKGIRGFPYDGNFPDHFGKLGTGRYNENHNVGEIWCACLMEMNRQIGSQLALQLVVDALKLSPATPNFLDMRDAILLGLSQKLAAGQLTQGAHDSALSGIWNAFSKFGMGQNAKANGTSLFGNVADFTKPGVTPGTSSESTISVRADPNLAIPDKDPVGISSSLVVNTGGNIKAFKLSVNIQHPFVGDLQVRLVAPDGATFPILNPSTNSSQNVVTTFTPSNTPGLADVLGRRANGVWTLKVADVARLSVGALRQWGLEIDVGAGTPGGSGSAHAEATPNLAIPDKDPVGITSTVTVQESGTIAEVTLSVEITHQFVGDLMISLQSPSGRIATVATPGMDASQNLIRTYTQPDTATLGTFFGDQAQGKWSLKVADLARLSVGTLRKWSVDLKLT